MEEIKTPKRTLFFASISSILFLIFYLVSYYFLRKIYALSTFYNIILIVLGAYILICSTATFLLKNFKKRLIYTIIKSSFLTLFCLLVGGFFVITSLIDGFSFNFKNVLFLSGTSFFSILSFVLLSLGYVKKYFHKIDPKRVELKHHFLGRFYQRVGIKVKLGIIFTLVLIVLIAAISFVFILRTKETTINQTREFCAYATEEVSQKVHNYLLQPEITKETMNREFPIMLKKYSKSMMIRGFSSASIEINWNQQNYYKSFTLRRGSFEVEIDKLPETYEREVLSRNDKPTSIYFMLNLIVNEDLKFKTDLAISRLEGIVKKINNPVVKKPISKKIETFQKKRKKLIENIKKLKAKINKLRNMEEQNDDPNFFSFRYPIVVFSRKKNPVLVDFEEKIKQEQINKFNDKIEKIKKVFFDEDGKLKTQWRNNRWALNRQMRAMQRGDEYLYQRVFNLRISRRAKEKFEKNIEKYVKAQIEQKIRKEGISELVPHPILVGLVKLKFNKQSLYKPIINSIYFVITIAGIILAIGVFLIVFLAIRITKPTKYLIAGANQIKKGNLNFTIPIKSKDEFGFLTSEFNSMVVFLKENKEMQKFISKDTISMIKDTAKSSSEVKLGGERKRMTFLFSDIRGFTSMSETKEPEEVVSIINMYLDLQSNIIEDCGGDIDKFVGDEIMARFTGPDMINNSVKAALKIQQELTKFNAEREKIESNVVVEVGIGINIGDVVVGSMGSHKRMDYTAIGDAVNLAARLCSAAEGGHILVSKDVYDNTNYKKYFIQMEPIKVKGKVKPIEIYDIPKPNLKR